MSEYGEIADIYELKCEGLAVTYRRGDDALELDGDDSVLSRADRGTLAAVELESGLLVTATLLISDRGGTRRMIALLLPEVRREDDGSSAGPYEVSGLAIRTTARTGGIGIPTGALQQYGEVLRLKGTASFSEA